MNLLQDDDSFNQWLGGVINDENFMDTTLTFTEQFDFVLKENGVVKNRPWDCSDVAIENQFDFVLKENGSDENRQWDCSDVAIENQFDFVLKENGSDENRQWDCSDVAIENQFDFALKENGSDENRQCDCSDVAIENQPVMKCGEPELKKRKVECNNFPSSTDASLVKDDIQQGRPSSCSVDSFKLKGGKRQNKRGPTTNLSSLIDNNVVMLGQKACYLNKKDKSVMAAGWITREGIKCLCCEKVYGISKFEIHAGSSSHRPSTSIFLEDGRSLMQCQIQIKHDDEVKGLEQDLHKQMASDLPHTNVQPMEDDINVGDSLAYLHEEMESDEPHPIIQQREDNVKDERFAGHQPHLKNQQAVGDEKVCGFTGNLCEELKNNTSCFRGNGICHICLHNGDGLLVCGGECLRMFHLSCIGLEVFPESVYFCPSCGCGLCGGGEYNNDSKQFLEKTILFCDQCERGYHVGCLRERGDEGLESCPEGNWFCGEKCSKIFFHLQNLLGKSNPTGIDGLSWTILRSNEKYGCNLNTTSNIEAMTTHKLRGARAVLRECFKRIVQPATKTDLITDVVFSKESTLPHLSYRGFYTMILNKGNKTISVATFRVHGDKVAEVPLVGTRIMYRRRGMRRLLMNNLQKILSDMGIKNLLLPAAPKLLQSWTCSFGFSTATNFDRFDLLEYSFLEFNDTILCKKVLIAPS